MRKNQRLFKVGDYVTYKGKGPFRIDHISRPNGYYANLYDLQNKYVDIADVHLLTRDAFMSDVSDILNHNQLQEQENKL